MMTATHLSNSCRAVAKESRKESYTRECKLCAINYFRDPGNTLYATAKDFSAAKKCSLHVCWSSEETKIKMSSAGSKYANRVSLDPNRVSLDLSSSLSGEV